MVDICKNEKCNRPAVSHNGFCRSHYSTDWQKRRNEKRRQAGQTCAVDGCTKAVLVLGQQLCGTHYYRLKRTGDLHPKIKPKIERRCKNEECGACLNGKGALGFCPRCYGRVRKYGTPTLPPRPEPKKKQPTAPRLRKDGGKRAGEGEPLQWLQDRVGHSGEDCLLWPYSRDRIGRAYVRHDGRSKIASRLMCELAHGPAPFDKAEAAHECGKGHLGCVNPRHLTWKTKAANLEDKIRHGTSQHGERNHMTQLTNEQVKQIYLEDGAPRKIAEKYGCAAGTVSAIKRGKIWQSVTGITAAGRDTTRRVDLIGQRQSRSTET